MKETKNNIHRINANIRSPKIRIVDENPPINRTLSNFEAKKLAEDRGLDLVEISFRRDVDGTPMSICKICEYNKYIYEKKKAEKEAAKRARENKVDTKSVKFHITSDVADVDRKCNDIIKFLDEGDKVRIEVNLRGREIAQKGLANDMMKNVLSKVSSSSIVDQYPKWEGKNYITVLRTNKTRSK